MPHTGLTASSLAADSNPAERTVPSSQPPSVLTSVSDVPRPPAGSGTMAPDDRPNGVPMEAVSSAPKGRDANVAEASNGTAGRSGLPVVRPEVPECFPDRSPSLFPKQEWAGRVTAIANGTFDARLRDLTGGGREENMEGPVSAWLPWVSVPVSGDARATCDVWSRKRKRRPAP